MVIVGYVSYVSYIFDLTVWRGKHRLYACVCISMVHYLSTRHYVHPIILLPIVG